MSDEDKNLDNQEESGASSAETKNTDTSHMIPKDSGSMIALGQQKHAIKLTV